MTEAKLVDALLGTANSVGELPLGKVVDGQPLDQPHVTGIPRKIRLDKAGNPCFTRVVMDMLEIATVGEIVVGVNARGLWVYVDDLGWTKVALGWEPSWIKPKTLFTEQEDADC